MNIRIVLLTLVLPFLLIGCNRANVDVERNPDGGVTVTATLSESDVNAAIDEALSQAENPLLRDPQVDLQAGQIVVNGQHERRDGGGTVSGSLTITVSVQGGLVAAQITQSDIEGFDLSDERIAQFNERLSNSLSRRAERDRGLITVQSINITDDALEIVFTAQRQ